MSAEIVGLTVGILLLIVGLLGLTRRAVSIVGFLIGLASVVLGGWLVYQYGL